MGGDGKSLDVKKMLVGEAKEAVDDKLVWTWSELEKTILEWGMHTHVETRDKEDGMTIGGVGDMGNAEGNQAPQTSPAQAMGQVPDMSGYELLKKLAECSETLPLVLMTGFGYDPGHSIVKARQAGLKEVLYKPFRLDQLLETVERVLTTANMSQSSGSG